MEVVATLSSPQRWAFVSTSSPAFASASRAPRSIPPWLLALHMKTWAVAVKNGDCLVASWKESLCSSRKGHDWEMLVAATGIKCAWADSKLDETRAFADRFTSSKRRWGQFNPQDDSFMPRAISGRTVENSTPSSVAFFELREGQSRFFHELPSGLKMEVIEQRADRGAGSCRVPIVFLHGSFHSAWCWAVHWLPFFAAHGHNCFALSLLGQGESDTPSQGAAGTLQSHARDVAHFIRHEVHAPPILLGHSFGGLIVQQYLSSVSEPKQQGPPVSISEGWEEPYPSLAAAILACSVPPTGNGGLVRRYIMTKPIASIKVTLSLAAKAFAHNLSLCQETFFSQDMPTSLVQRYQKLLARSSTVPLFNLRELNAVLPVCQPPIHAPPILVIGAENDFVVDKEGIQETATFYGTNPVVLPGIAHDIMLDTTWENAAQAVDSWLKGTGL